jgi:6-phosphogluconolactonase
VTVELVVRDDHEGASEHVATLLADAAGTGRSLALSGGSTPRLAYQRAAELAPNWSRATVWLGDDRYVDFDDPRSNVHLVREAILDRLAGRPRFLHEETGLDPDEAARRYDALLRREGLPTLQLLGVGPDGHTASLFPHAPSLIERERLAVAAEAGLEPFVARITMTLPAIAAADDVVFLVTGADKAERARQAFAESPTPAIPASLARSAHGRTTVVLDRAAAQRL